MGKNTFEQALTFGEWQYGNKQVIVMSRKGIKIPEALRENVIISAEDPALLLNWLAFRGTRQVYVDGGQTIQSFLREGLISELNITTIPILLGSGRPLFGSLKADINLRHIFTKPYPFGFVQSRYAVVNDAGAQTEGRSIMQERKNTRNEPDFPKGMGQPAVRALASIGVTQLAQLTNYREADLLKLHGIGRKGMRVLKEALAESGLTFADSEKK